MNHFYLSFHATTRRHPHVAFQLSLVAIALLAAGLFCGCGSSGGAPHFDEAVARNSLTTVLDAWKQGQAPAALQQGSPKIIVGDMQWNAGAKLMDYEVLEPSSNDGSNLRVRVALKLEDATGHSSQRQVEYLVGTSPQITVFSQEPDEDL